MRTKADKLTGATDGGGCFYFICPKCQDRQVMRVLDYAIVDDGPVTAYPELRPQQKRDFEIAFQAHCLECGHAEAVRITNTGIQGGKVDWTDPKARA